MSCPQTLVGIAKDCQANMGGIEVVLIANKDDVASITVTDGEITAITMGDDGATPPVPYTFKEYHFRPQSSNLTSEYQIDDAAGTKYVQSQLALVFSRMETAKRIEIGALALADAVAIVGDCNGKWWFLGYDHPLHMNAGGGETGTARGDRNAYTITLQDESKEMPMEVDATVVAGLRS
ncbi:MAG: hypothetical protein K6A62_04705 [Bacteroidales bacterium]|nr:hypothetical protein [Bacteroidales bacterium]